MQEIPYGDQAAAVDEAIATFPKIFGLRKFPGMKFHIVRSQSFYSPGYSHDGGSAPPSIQLYTFIVDEDGKDQAFARGSVEELRGQVVEL